MISRKQTDIEVFCASCGTSCGYVVEQGHRDWLCASCGNGKFRAVNLDTADPRIHGQIVDAYAVYDSDPRVHGPEDFAAFADAVQGIPNEQETP